MPPPRLFHSTQLTEAEDGALSPAVLEFRSPSNLILEAAPKRSARNTIWTVAALVATMLLVSAFVPMDMEVTAEGQVISRAPTIQLEPLSTAIVRSIDAHVGEVVHTGQVLATLDPTEAEADLKTLLAKRSALAAEVAEQRAEFASVPYEPADPANRDQMLQSAIYAQRMSQLQYTLAGYAQRVRGLAAKVEGAAAQAAYYRDELALANEIEGMNRTLAKLNAGSRLTVLQSEQQRIQTASEVASSVEDAKSAQKTLEATKAERDAFLQQWKASLSSKLATNVTELDSVKQSIAKAELASKLVTLRAPEDAVVLHIQNGISPGSVLQSGQQFIALSPLHAPLEVESYVKGSDQGFVQPGQPVTIKFATFPFVLFGTASGTVRLLTSNSFTPEQIADQLAAMQTTPQTAPRDVPTSELYYGARIAIDELHLRRVPPDFQVRPGMPVETDIRVGSQTLLQYLLERVAPLFYQGMREPS